MLKNIPEFPGGSSVLMAVYKGDNPDLLSRAITSVCENTLQPNQFLIVIDGPIDGKLKKILTEKKHTYPSIDLLFLPQNLGLAMALNEGLKHLKFSWVIRADADDYNHPNRFSALARELVKNPDIDLLGSSIVETDNKANPICFKIPPLTKNEIKSFIRYRNPFNHMSVVFKLDKVRQVGGYPNIYLKEDYALWALLLGNNAEVINIPDVLVTVTAGQEMYARRGGLRYAKSEIKLQIFLFKNGLQSLFMAALVGMIRVTIFLMPNWIRGKFYESFLRHRV